MQLSFLTQTFQVIKKYLIVHNKTVFLYSQPTKIHKNLTKYILLCYPRVTQHNLYATYGPQHYSDPRGI